MKNNQLTIVEESTTGLRMPEQAAAAIGELSKGLPADFKYHRKAFDAKMENATDDDRSEVSVITSDAVDRDGEVVVPGGGDWTRYNKGVYLNHDYDQFAGSCKWMKAVSGGGKLLAKTHYPTKPADWGDVAWLPSMIRHFQQQETPTLTGKSIGFLPMNVRKATAEERSTKGWGSAKIIDKWAGVEYSVCGIPVNPDAEMIAVLKALQAGIVDPEFVELVSKMTGKTLADVEGKGGSTANIVPANPIQGEENAINNAGDMPICPTCKDASSVIKSDNGYSCKGCGHTFDDPSVVRIPPDQRAIDRAALTVKAFPFVTEKAIGDALERIARKELDSMNVAGQVADRIYARMMLMLGRA